MPCSSRSAGMQSAYARRKGTALQPSYYRRCGGGVNISRRAQCASLEWPYGHRSREVKIRLAKLIDRA